MEVSDFEPAMGVDGMKPHDLEGLNIADMMTMAEEKLSDGLTCLECVLAEMEPQNKEAKDDMSVLQDCYDIMIKAFSRAESSMWEVEE